MAATPFYSDFAVTLPDSKVTGVMSHSLDRLNNNRQRQQEIDYRNLKDKEAEDWRKINLIQDLTDLSKFQTGSDIANAIGNQQASKVLQKYSDPAVIGKMSGAELQATISKEMSGVAGGMNGIKTELENSDKQIAQLKQLYPELDVASIAKDYRADVLHRRMKSDSEFFNPIEVQPTQFDFSNPEILSRYVTDDKNLRSYFQNPQGMDEMSVFKGTPNSYTKYTAKVPAYKKPNFDPATLKNGFLTGKDEPVLQFKSTTLPSNALPSSNGKPFEMIDKDVYDGVTGKEKIELIAATRKAVPNYDKMNPTEKEYAQRHVLLQTAKSFDQTGFHPTEVHTPSASLIKLWNGGGTKDSETQINDAVGRIVGKLEESGKPAIFVNELSLPDKGLIMDYVNKGKSETTKSVDADVFVQKDEQGKPAVYDRTSGKRLGYLDAMLNYKVQPGAKERREVIKQGNEKSYNYKGKTFTETQLQNAAKQSGMTVEEYKKELGIK